MLDNGRISSVQLLLLLTITQDATAFLFVPAIVAKAAGPDAWISTLIPVTIYGLAVAWVCLSLCKRFPKQVLSEYLPSIIGRIPGKILAAAYTLVFIHLTSVVLAEGTFFIHAISLRETPLLAINLVFVGVAIYGVFLGIEVITRQNELVFPIFFLSIAVLILLVIRDFDYHNLLPVMENGIIPVLNGSLIPASWRGEVFFILMLFPYLNQKDQAAKTLVIMIAFATVITTIINLATVGVFGDQVTAKEIFPVYSLARYISLADIVERLDLIVVIIWVGGAIVKLAVFYHISSISAAATLGLNNYKITILPIALITLIIAEKFYVTHLQLIGFLAKVWPIYALVIELLVPGLLLIITVLRKKGEMQLDQPK